MEDHRKGIIYNVSFNDKPVLNWAMHRLPMTDNFTTFLEKNKDNYKDRKGGIFYGQFKLTQLDDTFFEFEGYDKGVVYVNGINLGRYWHVGSQKRLYCPGVWLIKGVNDIVVVDWTW